MRMLFIAREGKRTGPYSEDQIRQMLKRGDLSQTDLVWNEGALNWQPLSTLIANTPPEIGVGFLVTIGDIGVSKREIVTPNGKAPLAGSQWIVRDMSRVESRIPPVAIVLAIIFAFACLLGLLFLLMRERWITGYVEVQVQSGSVIHMTQIPVSTRDQIAHIRQKVAFAQSMAAAAKVEATTEEGDSSTG
jgi:hypothetical protein